jgi:hypothetical protein
MPLPYCFYHLAGLPGAIWHLQKIYNGKIFVFFFLFVAILPSDEVYNWFPI